MSARKFGVFFCALGFALFLYACGDLGMVLPSQGSYRVSARVTTPRDNFSRDARSVADNSKDDYSLDVYSIVNKYSDIQPYFINSVANDPDVRGLTVFVQDYSGNRVSRKVRYQLELDEEEAQKSADEPNFPTDEPESPTDEPESPTETLWETPDGTETPAEENPDGSAEEVSPDDPPKSEAPMPDVAETAPAKVETTPVKVETTPVKVETTPAKVETAPVKAETTPVKVETTPVKVETTPAKVETAPVKAETAPVKVETAPVKVETAPAKVETAPAKVETTPAKVETTPAKVETTPAKVETAPVKVETTPAKVETTPAKVETTPAKVETAPVKVETTPAKAETVPAKVETAPVKVETTPAKVETAPAKAETAPVKVETVPAKVETASADAPAKAGTGTGASAAPGNTGTDASGPDTVADSSAPGPGATVPEAPPVVAPPEEPPKPPIPAFEIVPVKQLDQDLPPFRITEDIAIGRYNLVFQVIGKGMDVILYSAFKPIYFLGDAKFTLEDIQSFLPMAVTGGRLIPMGINVMLKTEIKADERLDPYVIWYNGKKVLAQGRISGGADYLLWETPEKTGFHNIRAEVFPLLPGERVPANMIGKIKELSLPVSSKSEGKTKFDGGGYNSSEFIGWYQFWGTLNDAKAPDNAQRKLVSLYAPSPRWIPFNAMYSLFVGRNDGYLLPGTPFKLERDEQGSGRMYFHLAALSEGSILSIRFAAREKLPRASAAQKDAGETADGTAELDLFLAGDALILRIASEDASREESLELGGGEFITVELEFVIAPDRFDAELRSGSPAGSPTGDPAKTTGLLSVALAKPISGEGVVRLGGGESPAGYKRSVNLPAFDDTGTFAGGTIALNELAFSYARQGIPEGEEEFDFGISESVWSEKEEPEAEQEPSSLSAL